MHGLSQQRSGEFTIEVVNEECVPGLLRFPEGGSARWRGLYDAQTDEARRRIADVMGELLAPFEKDSAHRIPAPTIVVSARRG